MADEVPSQGRFIGWLALVLMGIAIIAAATVLIAGGTAPPVL